MSKPIETRAPSHPFIYRVVPVWSDMDPARIVYTGRYTDYGLRAIDAWLKDRTGADFYTINFDWGIGTPFVHTECDIKASLTTRDAALLAVRVEKIGTTSLAFRVDGVIEASGVACMSGRFVCVCVDGREQGKAPKALPWDARIRVAAETDLAASAQLR
jgi:4-hydroxybenzoyl-CoA thioesterase